MWWVAVDDRPRQRVSRHSDNRGCTRGCVHLGCMAGSSMLLVMMALLAIGFVIAVLS